MATRTLNIFKCTYIGTESQNNQNATGFGFWLCSMHFMNILQAHLSIGFFSVVVRIRFVWFSILRESFNVWGNCYSSVLPSR